MFYAPHKRARQSAIVDKELHLSITQDPNTALAITALGVMGIYWECCAPGRIVPGVAGMVLATAGIASLAVLPIKPASVLLLAVAFILFALEATLVTRGLFTAMGAVAMFFGSRMLGVNWIAGAGVAAPFAAVTSFLFSAAVRARRNKAVGDLNDILRQETESTT